MSPRHIIIDGYNVIRSEPRLQHLEATSLELARDTLVRTLESSPRLANDRLIVVFDGRFADRQHLHAQRRGRVEVVFSGRGQTADEVIVNQAEILARSGRVVVVSDDVEVRERSRAAGSEISACANLLNQIPGRVRKVDVADRDEAVPSLSTVKRGNPRRSSRKGRKQEIRF